MLFNVFSIIGLIISVFTIIGINRSKNGLKYLKVLAIVLFVYKTLEYIIMNVFFEFSFPIEISTITYFMFSIIVLFDMKKYYHIAAFFALVSGLGFFLYYSIFGFISSLYFGYVRHFIAVISHGILLVGGSYLFFKQVFSNTKKTSIIITMLAIIAHGSIFYTDSIKNTTFIYFLVNPEFLMVTNLLMINHMILLGYYVILFSVFVFIIEKFFLLNKKYHENVALNCIRCFQQSFSSPFKEQLS